MQIIQMATIRLFAKDRPHRAPFLVSDIAVCLEDQTALAAVRTPAKIIRGLVARRVLN